MSLKVPKLLCAWSGVSQRRACMAGVTKKGLRTGDVSYQGLQVENAAREDLRVVAICSVLVIKLPADMCTV